MIIHIVFLIFIFSCKYFTKKGKFLPSTKKENLISPFVFVIVVSNPNIVFLIFGERLTRDYHIIIFCSSY